MTRNLTRTARLLRSIGILLASTVLPAAAEVSGAVRTSSHEVKGLQQPAELIIDQWGIPHIYAGSTRDAIFLQGYNAARDRLWQIDLWRKRGLGLLAKDFGPSYFDQDRAARLFLYRGDMDQEWASYGPDARNYTEAFVTGVNAFVDEDTAGEWLERLRRGRRSGCRGLGLDLEGSMSLRPTVSGEVPAS
ncbi:penicillin acylase family protein, partial [Microvirga sp. GCM10011540]|uniref:penicillin acylase family protein n=1 Tax=Microvirga sp. GCM10011540 TaxID=3317338 RepID=UPI00361A960C